MNDISLATIGHNAPPLAERLAAEHEDDLHLAEELLAAAKTAPDRIDDDTIQTQCAELVKKMRAVEIKLNRARELRNKPLQDEIAEVNGFYKVHMDRIEKPRKTIMQRSEEYLQRKADAEKRRLAEDEERRRAAAAEALRLAQEAERSKSEAASAAAAASALAEDAASARAAAWTDQENAAADVAAARAEIAVIKAEAAQFKTKLAIAARDKTAIDAGEIEAMAVEFAERFDAARLRAGIADTVLKAAREAAAAARAEQQRQEAERRKAEADVKTAGREAQAQLSAAVREEKIADRLAAKIEGPEADLARTRSLHGAVSTLARQWKCEVVDRALLDKEALWPFIHGEAIDAALWKWMMAQAPDNRRMAGTYIAEETVGQIR